jgi:hypothetical protein
LLAEAMAKERSPLLDVVGDVSEVAWPDATRPEASSSSSSSEDSSSRGFNEDADAEAGSKTEQAVVVDPRKWKR